MELTELPFPTPGVVYRSAMPYSAYDLEGRLVSEYQNLEISTVIMLSSDEENQRITGKDLRALYRRESLDVIYFPISDFSTPEIGALREIVHKALNLSRIGKGIVIHCHAGIGRTGMFVACMAKDGLEYSSEEAISWIREYIPGAIEIPEQEMMVRSF